MRPPRKLRYVGTDAQTGIDWTTLEAGYDVVTAVEEACDEVKAALREGKTMAVGIAGYGLPVAIFRTSLGARGVQMAYAKWLRHYNAIRASDLAVMEACETMRDEMRALEPGPR